MYRCKYNNPPKGVNGAKDETKRRCPVSRIGQWFTSASKRRKFPVAMYNIQQIRSIIKGKNKAAPAIPPISKILDNPYDCSWVGLGLR